MNPERKVDSVTVREFYGPVLRGESLYLTRPKQWFVPWSDKPLFVSFGQKAKDADEARARGFYETTCKEFHRLVLGDEKFNELRKVKEPDDRTLQCFDAVAKSIGLLDRKDGYDGERFEVEFELPVWIDLTGSGQVDCGRLDDRWVAEWSFRTDIDDYNITDVYFDRRPTTEMVIAAQSLSDAKRFLARRRYDPSFTCWECGLLCEHWLDIQSESQAETLAAGFQAKFGAFQEFYCGC